jgi:hypothetical protein
VLDGCTDLGVANSPSGRLEFIIPNDRSLSMRLAITNRELRQCPARLCNLLKLLHKVCGDAHFDRIRSVGSSLVDQTA